MKRLLIFLALSIVFLVGCSGRVERYKIVAFGDSNTQGANWTNHKYQETDKWVNLLSASITGSKGNDSSIIFNAGISGETTEDARKRLKRDVLKISPELVLIMFGTNDAAFLEKNKPRVSKERFRENLIYFIKEIEESGGKPVLMTCLPIVEGNGSDHFYYTRYKEAYYDDVGGARQWHNSYNNIIRELAFKNEIALVDHWSYMVYEAGGDTDEALLKSGIIDPSGNHLTPKGAKLIYENILKSDILAQN